MTRWGAVVRADALDGLTDAGWAALAAHGVRTVIDLRHPDERGRDAAARVVEETLGGLDVEACLRAGGLTAADVAALRRRVACGP